MAAVVELVLVALSVLVSVEGSSHVLKAVGDSVQLNAPDPGWEFDDCFWKFNGSTTVLKYLKKYNDVKPSPKYEDRVEFNSKTCSLTLKNLRRSDSGQYEVLLSTTESTVSKQVDLSVLDPVEAPVLTHYQSNNTCNSTLFCRGHDLSINSSCYRKICEEKKETSSVGVVLSLSVRHNSIICNQSNPVSWKEDVMEIQIGPHCAGPDPQPQSRSKKLGVILSVVVVILVVLVVLAGFVRHKIRQWRLAANLDVNTIYASVVTSNTGSPPDSTLEMPFTVYSDIKKNPQHPSNGEHKIITKNQEPVPASDTVKPPTVTIYATVTKSQLAVNGEQMDGFSGDQFYTN